MSTATHAPPSAATTDRQRIQALDVLRGVALCGILLVNVQPIADQGRAVVDSAAATWLGLFTDQRFFPIFSLLFGVGFALQFASASDRVARPRLILVRRLLVLLAIGAVHFLVWSGDILTTYAVVGLLVLLPSSWLPRWATAVAAGTLIAAALLSGGERLVLVAGLFLLGSTLVRYRLIHRIGDSARGPLFVGGLFALAAVPMVWTQANAELSATAFSRVLAVTGLLRVRRVHPHAHVGAGGPGRGLRAAGPDGPDQLPHRHRDRPRRRPGHRHPAADLGHGHRGVDRGRRVGGAVGVVDAVAAVAAVRAAGVAVALGHVGEAPIR